MKKHLLALFTIFIGFAANAQNSGNIKGTITNKDEKPIMAATISINGTKFTTATDDLGRYSLKDIPAGKYLLTISSIGYSKKTKNINVTAGGTLEIDFLLVSSVEELNEITVTGNKPVVTSSSEYVAKLPLTNLENAQVYTGITNTLMVQQKIYTIDEALRNVTGLNKSSSSNFVNTIDYGGSSFSLRGFNTQIRALNGMANNMASTSDIINLEKIEVIKGPSATLFGNIISSYGGLINRVTKKPFDYFSGSAEYTAGTYGFNRLGLDINSPLNKEKTFLSRINVAVQNRNTFQDNGAYERSVFMAPSFTYKLSDRVQINLNTEINFVKDGGMGNSIFLTLGPSFVNGYLPSVLKSAGLPDAAINQILAAAPTTIDQTFGAHNVNDFNLDYYRSYVANDLTTTTNSLMLNGEIHYKISDQWRSVTSLLVGSGNTEYYDSYKYLVPNEIPTLIASLATGVPDFGKPGADKLLRAGRKGESSLENQQIQQNFIGDYKLGNMRNRTVIGLDFTHNKLVSIYRNFKGSLFGIEFEDMFDNVARTGDVPNYYDFNKASLDKVLQDKPGDPANFNTYQNVYSTYVNDVLNITDQIIASAGLRIDRFDDKGKYDGVTNKWTNSFKKTAFSPKLGLVYQPIINTVSLFGNYQTSYTNFPGQDVNGNGFKPQKAHQWETGVKTSFNNGQLTGTLSYYNITVNDIIRIDNLNPLYNIQEGTQRSRGIEAEILGNPIPELNILLGYAYNDSKMVKSIDLGVLGLRPAGSGPKHQVNFWAQYHFSKQTVLNGISAGFGGNYNGETYIINLNPDGSIVAPAYTVLNAKLSFDRPKYSFGLRVNNLTNQKYWVGTGRISPQMPIQYVASIGIKF